MAKKGKAKKEEEAPKVKKPSLKDAGAAVGGYFSGNTGAVWSGIVLGALCFAGAGMFFGAF